MSDVIPQYPWHEGDHLHASALNAAIADGPYLNNWHVTNVIDFGADPTGVADSAPAFRAAMGSHRRILVPPGTYLFNSATALPAPYSVGANPNVLVQGFTNFVIEGYGATIIFGTAITAGGYQANQSCAFMVDRCTNWAILGLTIQCNRTGLTTVLGEQPNVGIFVINCTDFIVSDIHITGYVTYAMDGDWWVNGLIKNIIADSTTLAMDVAYLYRCMFDNCRFTGSDLLGTGISHPGTIGFSCIIDPPNATTNFTAIPTASFTSHTTYRNCSATNFVTGWYATTGKYYLLQGNRWTNNPGGLGGAPGIGVSISYDPTNGVGVPISNVTISGDTFSGSGATVAGYGLYIGNAAGSDYTSDITIASCQFDNNINIGIAGGGSNVRRLQAFGNVFTGAGQTTDIFPPMVANFTAILGGTATHQVITGPISNGRLISQIAGGGNPSVSVNDGTNGVGMFLSGGLFYLGTADATGAPLATWVKLTAALTTFDGYTMTQNGASITDGALHFGMFMQGTGFALGPTTSAGAPSALWATFDSVGNLTLNHLVDATSDANAASLGVPVGALYKSSGVVHVRLT